MSSHNIIHDYAERALSTFSADVFDLAVASPPYDDVRTYEGYEWNFEVMAAQIHRVLKPGGTLCWVVNDSMKGGCESLTSARQKIFFVEGLRFRCRTLIYQKRNFSHPNSAWYHSVFEYVFVLSKGKLKAWNPIMDRKNKTAGCVGNLGVNTFTERDGTKSVRSKKITAEYGKRHNVWLGNTRGQEDMCLELKHPAMMPKWLARDLILSFSNPGDHVLDPMAGSFTTVIQALLLGRHGTGIDSNAAYCDLGRKQIADLKCPATGNGQRVGRGYIRQ